GRALAHADAATLAVVAVDHVAARHAPDREIGAVMEAVVAGDAGAAREAALRFGERLPVVESGLHLGIAGQPLRGVEPRRARPRRRRVVEAGDRLEAHLACARRTGPVQ